MAIILPSDGTTFLDGVNRVLRMNSIIKGDDDNITTFSSTQHAAYIELARISIQNELNSLISERLIPFEKTSDTVALIESQRTYGLATDFIRFFGTNPSFYDSVDNIRIYMLRGGEDALRDLDFKYKTAEGNPSGWYWDSTTSKKVGFYQVPDSVVAGRSYEYDYEKSVSVTVATDQLPFYNAEEYQSFVSMAAQRFKYTNQEKDTGLLSQDATWISAKVTLLELMRPVNPPKYYGRRR